MCLFFFSLAIVNLLNSKCDPKVLKKAYVSAFTQKILFLLQPKSPGLWLGPVVFNGGGSPCGFVIPPSVVQSGMLIQTKSQAWAMQAPVGS